MKTRLSLKRRLAVISLAMALSMPLWATPGLSLAALMARNTASPQTVAVNWNSNAMPFAPIS